METAPFYLGILFCVTLCCISCGQKSPALSAIAPIQERLKMEEHTDKPFDLFLRVFKQEGIIEIWVRPKTNKQYVHLLDYPICRKSGDLGPKREEGDLQVPEGIYHIDRFNPNSRYHLSLGINYPNKSDLIRGNKSKIGGDIFIHGKCVTVGCLPITDPLIEELYALAEMAKAFGNSIPVHIFPYRMNEPLPGEQAWSETTQGFWEELRPLHDFFEEKAVLPVVEINDKGTYLIR